MMHYVLAILNMVVVLVVLSMATAAYGQTTTAYGQTTTVYGQTTTAYNQTTTAYSQTTNMHFHPKNCSSHKSSIKEVQKLIELFKEQLKKKELESAPPTQQLSVPLTVAQDCDGLSAKLLLSIIMVESRMQPHAINLQSLDYGLMQLNHRTMQGLEIDLKCALDWRCNLLQGIKLLKTYKRDTAAWWVRFNVGLSSKMIASGAARAYADKVLVAAQTVGGLK